MSKAGKPSHPTVRSPQFQYIPSDAINVAIGEDGIKLILGVNEAEEYVTELVGVHMSIKTATALNKALTRGLKYHEEHTGHRIEDADVEIDAAFGED